MLVLKVNLVRQKLLKLIKKQLLRRKLKKRKLRRRKRKRKKRKHEIKKIHTKIESVREPLSTSMFFCIFKSRIN